MEQHRNDGDALKGLVAGVVGGLAASWAMNAAGPALSRLFEGQGGDDARPTGEDGEGEGKGEDPKVQVATAISQRVLERPLTERERELAGPAVHYAFGAAVGGAYGMLADLVPAAASGAGLPFGTAVWLAADEAALPALGLSPPPTDYPPSTHAHSLASHWIYGLTTDLVRRLVRCIL